LETGHTYIHKIDFYTLYNNNFFHTARTVKMSIFLWYNLDMRYRLSLLSIQSVQPLLRSDNLGSSQLLVSRKDTRSVSRYAWTWRETLPCLLICSNIHCKCSKSIVYVTCIIDIEYSQWILERSQNKKITKNKWFSHR